MRQPTQVLVYAARRTDGGWEYLLLRRTAGRGGFWQGVTGGVERGEDIGKAAERELREETGFVQSSVRRLDYSYSFPVEDKWRHLYAEGVARITEYVFVTDVGVHHDPTIDPGEHDRWEWCDLSRALELLTWPENKEALRRCDDLLRGR